MNMHLLKFSNEESVFSPMLIPSILIALLFYIIILFYIKRTSVALFWKNPIFGENSTTFIHKRLKKEL